jgi:hypothetical protein
VTPEQVASLEAYAEATVARWREMPPPPREVLDEIALLLQPARPPACPAELREAS